MGLKLILVLLLTIVVVWKISTLFEPPPLPDLDQNEWWGPKQLRGKTDDSIRPFKIQFTEELINDIRARLSSRRPFVPPLEGTYLEYGMNTNQLEGLLKYWEKDYPFKQRETYLNQFPQFKTNIQGLDIHFIRVKPEAKKGVSVVPLLLLHGWPGSMREFYEAIPLLKRQRPGVDFVFEVIVPSLPGYGFSDAAVKPGLGSAEMAVVVSNLMKRLGFTKYYVQGGDAGAVIASIMATLYPEQVLGMHSNMAIVQSGLVTMKTILGSFAPSLVVEKELEDRLYPLSSFFCFLLEEFGYFHIQATKPDTVGTAVAASPQGLAAYILEKFATWTVRGAKGLPEHLSKDAIFDNIMIYWVSNSMNTAMRLYAESFTKKHLNYRLDDIPTPVPTWVQQAKHELFYNPPGFLKTKYTNLLGVTVMDNGGHFLALELPKDLTDDVYKAVGEFRNWHQNKKENKSEL